MSTTVYFRLPTFDKISLAQIPRTVPKNAIPLMFEFRGRNIVVTRLFKQKLKAKGPVFNWNGPDNQAIEAADYPHLCLLLLRSMRYLSVGLGDPDFVTSKVIGDFKTLYPASRISASKAKPQARTKSEAETTVEKTPVKRKVKVKVKPVEVDETVEEAKPKAMIGVTTTKNGVRTTSLFPPRKKSDTTDKDSFDNDPHNAKHGSANIKKIIRGSANK